MAKNLNEDRILGTFGSEKNPIVLRFNEYKGHRTLDIRKFYYDRKSNEIKPTQKGIGLGSKVFSVVKNILIENEKLINDWLEKETGNVEGEYVKKHVFHQEQAKETTRVRSRLHTSFTKEWKSPSFFEIESLGGTDKIGFNKNHLFHKVIKELIEDLGQSLNNNLREETTKKLMNLIEVLLLSYYRSKLLFSGIDSVKPEELFSTLEFNWGAILDGYLE